MFRIFKSSKTSSNEQSSLNKQDSSKAEARAEAKRRAIDIVSHQPAGSPACKCSKCGAIVDSTAELSAEGKIHCNYCNEWSSIL
jgi:formylmethanofuran dehydrogenase subunit E